MSRLNQIWCVFLFLFALPFASANVPLDDYVYTPDPNYGYKDTGLRLNGTGWKSYLLNMTSQRWLSEEDTSCSLWWHVMAVIVPDNITCPDCSGIWITGGDNDGGIPKPTDEDIVVAASLAVSTGSVVTSLFQVSCFEIVDFSKFMHLIERFRTSLVILRTDSDELRMQL